MGAIIGGRYGHYPEADEFVKDYNDTLKKHEFNKYRWSILHRSATNEYCVFRSFKSHSNNSLKETKELTKDAKYVGESTFEGKFSDPSFNEWWSDYSEIKNISYGKSASIN